MTSFASRQSSALARGLSASVERSKEKHELYVLLQWTGPVPESSVLSGIRQFGGDTLTVLRTSPDSKAAELETALERSELQVEQLRQQLREAQAKLEMQPPAATERDRAISIADWAKELRVSYSTAWRYKRDGRVRSVNVGGGNKHNNDLVYPATFVPPIKGKKQ